MGTAISGLVVAASGLFLIGLAALVVFDAAAAKRFLRSFASSARAHYTEQLLRLIAGLALVNFAAFMHWPALFRAFGWLIAVTAVALLLVPWQWHHRFGQWAIPFAIRYLRLFAVCALALGALVLYGFSRVVLP